MALEAYRRKRNFKVTPEPPPQTEKGHRKPIFVVQEHHASKLHYDLRLEADGVLKSWAVTKEPTLDPSIKRLAVEVEDHPIAYAEFSGDIPEGEYGAGHVEIWDRGTYENLSHDDDEDRLTVSEGIEAGRLEFRLNGKKLKGAFAMVRMKGEGKRNNWLLIKMKDNQARPGSTGKKIAAAEPHRASSRGAAKSRDAEPSGRASKAPAKAAAKAADEPTPDLDDVGRTNESKVMFPEVGITKGDVLDYYERIAQYMLPHLIGRPITVERLPNGLSGDDAARFWQKNTPEHYPDWIERVPLESTTGETVNYALINDVQSLLYFVNQGALVFHVWMSRIQNLDRPDYVLFDLDPGPNTTIADLATVAKSLFTTLDASKTKSVLKTSGKRGLHVLVPWKREGDYDEAREWAMAIARRVSQKTGGIATTERSKDDRGGMLYIDVMQNVRGHHAVAPYTLRATPEATISTPLEWRELNAKLDPGKFTLKTIFRRLARQKSDPLAALLEWYG